jgi:hypothetical protein
MNVQMYRLDHQLTTRPIQTGRELSIEPRLYLLFGYMEDPDCIFGNSSVPTRTQTWIGSPEPLLALVLTDNQYMVLRGYFKSQ